MYMFVLCMFYALTEMSILNEDSTYEGKLHRDDTMIGILRQ